ncbi:O-antigen ligase family protein [Sinomicrobium weinanense]|uniref:O-antigen ligase family protein n=1 Tax=Sinomicrobium weinanense TaxID=2842200 RepID=A0A926JWB6_9FLAO|nr:O-antigen ligase family protein [Sinomicrobium weinanense]MBC9798556.1 O-antigen ligase family protein [Sinomicrobium weinanense]MBU3125971.1 O-antigen ligase family protein [Sinomicrobium weinanense]
MAKFKIFIDAILSGAICLLLIVLASVNVPDLINSTQTGKSIFFFYSVIFIVILTFVKLLFSPLIIRIKLLDGCLLILLFYISINRYWIQSVSGFSLRYYEFIGLSFLYLALRNTSFKALPYFLLSVCLSGILQAILGFGQLLGYIPSNHAGFKMTGSFFNPGPFGGFLAIVFVISLGSYLFREQIMSIISSKEDKVSILWVRIQSFLFHYVPLVSLILILIILPSTRSRAAWFAVLVGGGFVLLYKYNRILLPMIQRWRKMLLWQKALLGVIALLLMCSSIFGVYHFKKNSADGRILIWKVSTSGIIMHNPAFGVGFDRFKANYMNDQADYFKEVGEGKEAALADNTYYAFNEVLQFIAENGFIGFVILGLTGIVCLGIKTSRQERFLKIKSLGVLLSLLAFGLFSYPMQILPIKMEMILALALLSRSDRRTIYGISSTPSRIRNVLVMKTCMICVLGLVVWQSIPKITSIKDNFQVWRRALDIYNSGLYKESLSEFKWAYSGIGSDGDFLMNYGKALVMANEHRRAREVLEQAKKYLNTTIIETALGDTYKGLGLYEEAEEAYQRASYMIPGRFYPEYLLAKLYVETGQHIKAKNKAEEVLGKKVKIPSMAIEEIKAEMRRIINDIEVDQGEEENPPGFENS